MICERDPPNIEELRRLCGDRIVFLMFMIVRRMVLFITLRIKELLKIQSLISKMSFLFHSPYTRFPIRLLHHDYMNTRIGNGDLAWRNQQAFRPFH